MTTVPETSAASKVSILSVKLSISGLRYFVYCILVSVILRVLLCLLKARGIQAGEHLRGSGTNEYKEFWKAFWIAFRGFGGGRIEDLWLPYVLGVGELAAYPILLVSDRLEIIGGWLALKTAGQWKVWEDSRTAFNRFLVLNVLDIAIAYFWLSHYISR